VQAAGYVSEVFLSLQGEGLYVGFLQVFLRTAGCKLRCRYCDTGRAQKRVAECILRGPGGLQRLKNPVPVDELVSFTRSLIEVAPGVHSLSVTGGEPLEQPDFLIAFLHRFQPLGFPVYLETNGLEEASAKRVAHLVDIVSMDVKLPSLCGGGDFFPTYRRVLPLFRDKELFCKVVVAEGFDEREFLEAVRLVACFDEKIPFIIQPASPVASCGTIAGKQLVTYYELASRHLEQVRVMPQCHHLLGLP
jgi:organic radical activating enzyme